MTIYVSKLLIHLCSLFQLQTTEVKPNSRVGDSLKCLVRPKKALQRLVVKKTSAKTETEPKTADPPTGVGSKSMKDSSKGSQVVQSEEKEVHQSTVSATNASSLLGNHAKKELKESKVTSTNALSLLGNYSESESD